MSLPSRAGVGQRRKQQQRKRNDMRYKGTVMGAVGIRVGMIGIKDVQIILEK